MPRMFQPRFLHFVSALSLCLFLLLSACATRQSADKGTGETGGAELLVHNARGEQVFSAPLPPGAEFGIRFTHSVALSPVEEWFVAKKGQVQLTRTVYADFGAGLPFEEQAGQRMTFEKGKVILTGFDLTLARLEVRVGRVAGHELLLPPVVEGQSAPSVQSKKMEKVTSFSLAHWAKPGEVLVFSVLQK